MLKKAFLSLLIMLFIMNSSEIIVTASTSPSESEKLAKRLDLYKNMEAITQIPWYYIAAADQYEHNLRLTRKGLEKAKGVIGIHIEPSKWVGALNPESS